MANYRNLCAHEDILYDHRTQRSIPDTRFHNRLSIEMCDGEYIYGKNDLFAVVIIMKQMLTENEFNDFMRETNYEIDLLSGKTNLPITNFLNKFIRIVYKYK